MKRPILFVLLPVAALVFGGCANVKTAALTGRVTFSQSAPSSSYGNGKVTCVTNNASCQTRWCLYTGTGCAPTLTEGQIVSASYLIPCKATFSATPPCTVVSPTGNVPISYHKLTTMTVTY